MKNIINNFNFVITKKNYKLSCGNFLIIKGVYMLTEVKVLENGIKYTIEHESNISIDVKQGLNSKVKLKPFETFLKDELMVNFTLKSLKVNKKEVNFGIMAVLGKHESYSNIKIPAEKISDKFYKEWNKLEDNILDAFTQTQIQMELFETDEEKNEEIETSIAIR